MNPSCRGFFEPTAPPARRGVRPGFRTASTTRRIANARSRRQLRTASSLAKVTRFEDACRSPQRNNPGPRILIPLRKFDDPSSVCLQRLGDVITSTGRAKSPFAAWHSPSRASYPDAHDVRGSPQRNDPCPWILVPFRDLDDAFGDRTDPLAHLFTVVESIQSVLDLCHRRSSPNDKWPLPDRPDARQASFSEDVLPIEDIFPSTPFALQSSARRPSTGNRNRKKARRHISGSSSSAFESPQHRREIVPLSESNGNTLYPSAFPKLSR